MDSAIRFTVGFIYFLAGLIFVGAVVFTGYRIYQMATLPSVEAEVLQADTESYASTSYRRNAAGWNEPTRTRMFAATALVRYSYNGKTVTAEAKHDVGLSSKWLQDRMTKDWKPGARIRIHLDPAQPSEPLAGLGVNLNTFLPAFCLVFFGFFLVGCGYGLTRAAALLVRLAPGLSTPGN